MVGEVLHQPLASWITSLLQQQKDDLYSVDVLTRNRVVFDTLHRRLYAKITHRNEQILPDNV